MVTVAAAGTVQFDGVLDIQVTVADDQYATFATTMQPIQDIFLYIDVSIIRTERNCCVSNVALHRNSTLKL